MYGETIQVIWYSEHQLDILLQNRSQSNFESYTYNLVTLITVAKESIQPIILARLIQCLEVIHSNLMYLRMSKEMHTFCYV